MADTDSPIYRIIETTLADLPHKRWPVNRKRLAYLLTEALNSYIPGPHDFRGMTGPLAELIEQRWPEGTRPKETQFLEQAIALALLADHLVIPRPQDD